MQRRTCWMLAAGVPIFLTSAASAQDETVDTSRPTIRVGPERLIGGESADERRAREAELFEWLAAETPPGTANARVIVGLTEQEKIDLATPAPAGSGPAPLRIGLVKSLNPGVAVNGILQGQILRVAGPFAGGMLQATEDGGFIWATTIHSPGADGMRVHLANVSLPAGAELYFYSPDGQVRGPYVGKGLEGTGQFWTNTLFSNTGIVALRFFGPYTAEDLRNISLVINSVGHIGMGFPKPVPQGHNWSHDRCGNASCVIDANCGNLGPAGPAADAVAKMEWIQGAFIYTCTGGLLADTDASTQRLLFLTANHCLSKTTANLETFFNYTTSSCNGNCPGSPAPHTTGGTLLATGRKGDFTLFELTSGSPPAGAVFLGWNNSPIAFTNGAHLYRVSNPNFGPQVFSHHQVDTGAVTCTGWPRGERIYSNDVAGATDGGSSGSPVVNSASEVVGQLTGCCGFNCGNVCDSGANSTVDGALAFYFSSVEPFLDPQGGGGCSSNAECDDGLFCNGAETCSGGSCQAGTNPCPGQGCNESTNQCVSCLPSGTSCSSNADCCSNKCKNGTCRG